MFNFLSRRKQPQASPSDEKHDEKSMDAGELQPTDLTLGYDQAWQDHMQYQRRTALAVLSQMIYDRFARDGLFADSATTWNSVALRLAKADYVSFPLEDYRAHSWLAPLCELNCEAACTITNPVVAGIVMTLSPTASEVVISRDERVQVLETIESLGSARKAQGAAFIRQDARLVVWSDRAEGLPQRASEMQSKLIRYVWKCASEPSSSVSPSTSGSTIASAFSSKLNLVQADQGQEVRIAAGGERLITLPAADPEKSEQDPESAVVQQRHTVLLAPVQHGLALALNLLIYSVLVRNLLLQTFLDHNYMRMAIVAAIPPLFLITLFFSDNIVGSVFQIFGPIRQMGRNTRYYSGVAPERLTGPLPHVTIQMPVYKEDLDEVLAPTIESINTAIQTYELQGGTASILVSEDGLLAVDKEERQRRIDFYERHQVAWIARPPHGSDGYIRKGRFKKASNLNFTCAVSTAVERMMLERRPEDISSWTEADERSLYDQCFTDALAAAHPQALGAGNVRIGELILLIDSDTRVPTDCFLDAASELSQCPDVAILQHCSGVMQVTQNNYFEAGIAFFTRTVNFAISYMVANGDVAPFMGHNAFLRWSALQEVAAVDEEDGVHKFWSEATVSEDFEMALKLLLKGYTVRWATYSKGGFQEGVSLTCDDELNRWQKYAFGVSELLFRPLKHIWKGPMTPLFRRFLWARDVPVHYKFCATSYIASYYAIAAALPLTVGLTLAQGLFAPNLDLAFLEPFKVFVAIVVVYNGLSFVGQVLAKFRSHHCTLQEALREHLTWLPFMMVFFTGLSYHVLTAILSHPFGINMSWGSTNKSLDDSNFFKELPAIIRKQWKMLCIVILALAGFTVLSLDVLPVEWQLHGGLAVLWCPLWLCALHIVYHIALNPQLLRFSF